VTEDDARALRWGAMSFALVRRNPGHSREGTAERAPSCCLRDRALRQRDQ